MTVVALQCIYILYYTLLLSEEEQTAWLKLRLLLNIKVTVCVVSVPLFFFAIICQINYFIKFSFEQVLKDTVRPVCSRHFD